MGQVQGIAYVKHALFGRVELWAVNMAAPRDGLGESWYPALFCVTGSDKVYDCALGRTALEAKEPLSREEALAAAPELVRRAEDGMRAVP